MASKNKKKLLKIILGNLSNAILHEILADAVFNELRFYYSKESTNSLEIAIRYRQKLSANFSFPVHLKLKLIQLIRSKLNQRIRKGYKNIDLTKIESFVEKYLQKIKNN
jgi:predicted Zn-dependent protease